MGYCLGATAIIAAPLAMGAMGIAALTAGEVATFSICTGISGASSYAINAGTNKDHEEAKEELASKGLVKK